MLEVVTLPVGALQANCHIAANAQTGEAIVVDPGGDADVILAALAQRKWRATAIWLTHAHIDHIGALAEVRDATGAPVWLHEAEKEWLRDGQLNLATWIGLPFTPCDADHLWKEGTEIEALGRAWRILHVPGHSPGQCAIVCDTDSVAFTGDLVFQGSIGRTDLPGGDEAAMASSLARLLTLPDAMRLHVGHGPATTVGRERASNPFLQG